MVAPIGHGLKLTTEMGKKRPRCFGADQFEIVPTYPPMMGLNHIYIVSILALKVALGRIAFVALSGSGK